MSCVSVHGRLNIDRDFGPHAYPLPYVCIEAATLTPWNVIHGRLPGSGRLPGTLGYVHDIQILVLILFPTASYLTDIVLPCKAWLPLNGVIYSRIQLKWVQEVNYGDAQYHSIAHQNTQRSNMCMDIRNGQVEKPAIFRYEQLKSKNTEIKSLHDA